MRLIEQVVGDQDFGDALALDGHRQDVRDGAVLEDREPNADDRASCGRGP